MREYLQDKDFLKQLDYNREKEVYIRIIALNNDELPIEEIVGRATGGSINVDGSSAVRRTCSLSLAVLENDKIVTDIYWCYNNKFKLEIGLKNNINKNYPDIIWFEMGLYIITSFSKNKTTNSLNISISGKDKMCRLNGEVSGNIMFGTDFGNIDNLTKYENEKGEIEYLIQKEKLTIKEIIKNAVKVYGQESEHNIIINDLDQYGYELWEYRGNTPMYMFINKNTPEEVVNITFDNDIIVYDANEQTINYTLSEISQYYSLNVLDENYNNTATEVKFNPEDSKSYFVVKIEYGQTVGYHQTPLVYSAEDLILNSGETITTLLDKLKNMLGDYEYFYDLQGRFVFQKKNTYIQELFSPINGDLIIPTMYASQYSYKFEDEKLFTAISDTPNINNIKNDFAVWGNKKGIDGKDIPIHVRYAIDKKPKVYKALDNTEYTTADYDWRELIYQMALDYYAHNQESDFLLNLQEANPQFIEGKTGYEQYYPDLQGFWRELYNPLKTEADIDFAEANQFEYYEDGDKKYWNKLIHQDPTQFKFWFDFLDTQGDLNKYSVKNYNQEKDQFITNIGTRSKVVNDNAVKSIYNRETPNALIVISPKEEIQDDTAFNYTKIQIQEDMENLFGRSSQGNSAIDRINELINSNTAASETISITSIPIYYLEPNTRIYVSGQGDYTLDKISYSLSYNGTMNISGNKIIKPIY